MIFNQKLSIKKYSTFLIIMFLSCSANKSFHNKKSLKVLEQEIARSIDRNNIENKLYLNFNSDNQLVSFIKETMSDSIKSFSIKKILTEEAYKRVFNKIEVSNYERQLKNNSIKIEKIKPGIHAKITGQQNKLYSAFAKTGEVLTLDKMAKIEIQAMVNAGVPKNIATGWVIKALENLKTQGVKMITHIPWNGRN